MKTEKIERNEDAQGRKFNDYMRRIAFEAILRKKYLKVATINFNDGKYFLRHSKLLKFHYS